VEPSDGRGSRAALTTIWFLLPAGHHSRWHVVASDEQWTFIEGDPLELFLWTDGTTVRRERLGPLGTDAHPVIVVPGGTAQAARSTGSYTLVACTVGPGFEFADFAMLADRPAAEAALRRDAPELADLL